VRAYWLIGLGLAACLPNGPPTESKEPAEVGSKKTNFPRKATLVRPSASAAAADPALEGVFTDDFERGSPGTAWRSVGGGWKIQDGRLCGQGARNRGIWLARRLPVNARIEFDAVSSSPDGDLKVEAWGDGISGATGASYNNATSYLFILGGWKNTRHVLARLNEHGEDRWEIRVDPSGEEPRARPVKPRQTLRVQIERSDGRTLSWVVDDVLLHRFTDESPLAGPGHEHFGFNDWETPVCFDNLRITPLPG
jgi:hypothetical protein